MKTEIKLDITTLPLDNQKVRWWGYNTDPKEGIYDANEQLFKMKNNKFDFAYEVIEWELIDNLK